MFKEHVKKEKSIHNTNVNIFFLNNSNHGMIKKDVIFFLWLVYILFDIENSVEK